MKFKQCRLRVLDASPYTIDAIPLVGEVRFVAAHQSSIRGNGGAMQSKWARGVCGSSAYHRGLRRLDLSAKRAVSGADSSLAYLRNDEQGGGLILPNYACPVFHMDKSIWGLMSY
jgi:hypothetical protein